MSASYYVGMVDITFTYFESLADWHKDPAGLEAVREIRNRMVSDLEAFDAKPTRSELAGLFREWRALRIEFDGEASYPPDMFIERVCELIDVS